ncbi:MAG: nickel/cobalt exporter [Natronomonas sp.]|jgi:nickel/cobalt exporter|uniref:HoxN/HupN/NixA family nickel/cobalt transporter n=1 Tax=Natronomonas sp. TaxID=2184060 RepID=UPI00398962E4
MSGALVAALATAGALGITHAIEPDHVAGISSITTEYSDSRVSALVGACFSLGHVALVVVWLAVASVLLERPSFPPLYDRLGAVGAGLVLGLLGASMAVAGIRRVLRTDEHDHGHTTHNHPHLHLPLPGFDGNDHAHDVRSYLKTGVVGALFTLSPPVSMLVFASTLLPRAGTGVLALAVLTYAVAITATMSLLGAGVGTIFARIGKRGATLHGVAQTVGGVAVVALALFLLLGAAPLPA